MTCHFEAEALTEYRDAARYSEKKFGLGEDFVQAMEDALATIAKDPERFQPVGDGIRIFRMPRFLYYPYYHYSKERAAIVIYAVAHHRRLPDYWRNRLH